MAPAEGFLSPVNDRGALRDLSKTREFKALVLYRTWTCRPVFIDTRWIS